MKPFNLEAAKRGEPIQTRDGRPAKFIAHVPESLDEYSRVVALVDGCLVRTSSDGGLYSPSGPSPCDLFMAPRTRKGWIVLWKTTSGWEVYSTYVYDKKEEAEERAYAFGATHRVVELSEWEE